MTTDAIAHARGYLAVIKRVQALALDMNEPRPPLWHPIKMLRHSAALRASPPRLTAFTEMQGIHARALRSLGAGSTAGVWGPFSVVDHGRISIEDALESFSGDSRAQRLRRELPLIRARAALDETDQWARYVDEYLVDLVGTGPLQESRGRSALWEFISVERRPQPDLAWHLMRSSKLLRLTVTDEPLPDDGIPTIVLGSINTHQNQGLGIGTAALRELCRYADASQLRIRARIASLESEDPAFQRLAGWYSRHGFRQGDAPATRWVPLGEMTRLPHVHDDTV